MGTRHLVAAVIDDAFKIAQYGQFDGDPAGQGAAIYDFIRNRDIDSFKPKLRQLRWMNDEDARTVAAKPDWLSVYPQFARDAGACVLDLVMDSPEPLLIDRLFHDGDNKSPLTFEEDPHGKRLHVLWSEGQRRDILL